MTMSALLATSEVMVAPFDENDVVAGAGAVASGAGGAAAGTAPAIGALPRNSGGVDAVEVGTDAPPSPPLSNDRSVCATRAASAFLRYTTVSYTHLTLPTSD